MNKIILSGTLTSDPYPMSWATKLRAVNVVMGGRGGDKEIKLYFDVLATGPFKTECANWKKGDTFEVCGVLSMNVWKKEDGSTSVTPTIRPENCADGYLRPAAQEGQKRPSRRERTPDAPAPAPASEKRQVPAPASTSPFPEEPADDDSGSDDIPF